MSLNVVAMVETLVEYGVEHLGRNMAATTVDTVRTALRRRYMTQLAMAAWRGYANLLLDKTKYVGSGKLAPSRAQIRHDMRGRGDRGSIPVYSWQTRRMFQ
jgi:hypothetical protein